MPLTGVENHSSMKSAVSVLAVLLIAASLGTILWTQIHKPDHSSMTNEELDARIKSYKEKVVQQHQPPISPPLDAPPPTAIQEMAASNKKEVMANLVKDQQQVLPPGGYRDRIKRWLKEYLGDYGISRQVLMSAAALAAVVLAAIALIAIAVTTTYVFELRVPYAPEGMAAKKEWVANMASTVSTPVISLAVFCFICFVSIMVTLGSKEYFMAKP